MNLDASGAPVADAVTVAEAERIVDGISSAYLEYAGVLPLRLDNGRVLVGTWLVYGPEVAGAGRGAGLVVLAAGGLLAWTLWRWAVAADGSVLAWPWYVPLGGAVATVTGWLLSGPADGSPAPASGDPVPSR